MSSLIASKVGQSEEQAKRVSTWVDHTILEHIGKTGYEKEISLFTEMATP